LRAALFVRERHPFRSANHDAAWLQEIEAPSSVQKTLNSAARSSDRRSRRSKTDKETGSGRGFAHLTSRLELVAVRDFDFAHVGLGLRRFEDTSCSLHSCRELTPERVPGGGASEWLPALVGRLRALEIIIGANDFDAATAVRYGWMNRSTPDVNSTASWMIWHRIASYQTRTIELTKKTIRRREVGPERGKVAHYLSPVTLRRGECWHA
jgi:hypothetical protein